jgi:hypothetical protein
MSSYSVDRLLDLRRSVENDAAIALRRALDAQVRAQAAHERLRRATAQAAAAVTTRRAMPMPEAQSALESLAQHRFLQRLAADADEKARRVQTHQQEVLRPAAVAVEAARQAHTRAAQDRLLIEQHRERLRATDRQTALRREENERDDRSPRTPRS